MFQRTCLECGASFSAYRAHASFCSTAHRMDWNARRAVRGAEVYDLVMSWLQGKDMVQKDMLAELNALASAYTDSDKHLRGGRRSWQVWRKAKLNMPRIYGSEGDKR